MKLLAIMAAGAIAAGNLMAEDIDKYYSRRDAEQRANDTQREIAHQIEKNTEAVKALTESRSGETPSGYHSVSFYERELEASEEKRWKLEKELEARQAEYQKAKIENDKLRRFIEEHAIHAK